MPWSAQTKAAFGRLLSEALEPDKPAKHSCYAVSETEDPDDSRMTASLTSKVPSVGPTMSTRHRPMPTIDDDIPQAETILSGIEDSIDAITLDEDKKPAARKTPAISNLTGTIAAINLKQDDMDQSMDSMSLHTAGPISDSVYALMLATEEEEEFNKQQRQSAGLTQTSFKQVKLEATIPDSVKVSQNQHQSAWNRPYILNMIQTIQTYLRLTTGSDVIPVHLTIERQFQLYDTLEGERFLAELERQQGVEVECRSTIPARTPVSAQCYHAKEEPVSYTHLTLPTILRV